MTTLSSERTARTLLNLHLVALHSKGKAAALADGEGALQFLMALPAHDERLSRLLQEDPFGWEQLRGYLQESLQELFQAESRRLDPLPVPVPPNLDLTLGYSGTGRAPFADVLRDARYLAFYYSTSDKPYWEDGLGGQTDRWDGYLTWRDHWRVSAGLGPYRDKLGAADADASHTWLLDRRTRLIYVAERRDPAVRRLLHDQWPPEAWPNISPEEAMSLLSHAQQSLRLPSQDVVMQMLHQQRQDVAELAAWLEQYWPLPVFGGGA